MIVESKKIKLSQLKSNQGQIQGLPKNPRLIKDEKYDRLKKSIGDDPEMLNLRELIVYPFEETFIVIAGNMRLKAMKELRYKEAPCKVLPSDTPVEKLRVYTIKDNVGFGSDDWDLLHEEWNMKELEDWGMDIKPFKNDEEQEEEELKTYIPTYKFEVSCKTEKEKAKLMAKLLDEGYSCTDDY